ncbi:YbhB/YbcL family Raf kinase inhibitor-like protein [Thioalkalivibrio thiocyanoxidans]|uniref:YbhB/YbcL family Raf kinase inhibitor-like protein n=1 Tax=Thioalkalivibrio thiocyanoxidans TaxID=152475 RepID=UPI00038149C1|nr:YbhB/YbcL family Raf kinase inhibitor-like protein [Thioalkalivibrio thiocyanoxidans]
MELSSNAFEDGGPIPAKFSAPEENDVPPLDIRGTPTGSKSLVLIFEDIDAAIGPVTHWLLWNLPPETSYIDAVHVPDEARSGLNGFGKAHYTGPAPPAGTHRYRFRLCALDTTLEVGPNAWRDQVEQAMSGHVLAETTLTGYFRHEDEEEGGS